MAESVKARANYVPLLNVTVMKLDDDRLTMRIELAEWSVLECWKDLPNPDSAVSYRDILKMAKRLLKLLEMKLQYACYCCV